MTVNPEHTNNDNILKAGREEFLEDVFGFNTRSARTIWVVFTKPVNYFKAARSSNWQDKYTPSIRLMLLFGAITMALGFIWAKPNGSFIDALNSALIAGINDGYKFSGHRIDVSDVDLRETLVKVIEFMGLIFTPIYIFLLSLLAWVYRAWGETLPYVIRQRYIFAVCIPASIFGIFWLLFTSVFTGKLYDMLGLAEIAIVILILFITAIRGPFGHLSKGKAFKRAFFLTVCIFTCMFLAQAIAIIVALSKIAGPEIQSAIQASIIK